MSNADLYVVFSSGEWKVKNSEGPVRRAGFDAQKEAVEAARELADEESKRIVVNARCGYTRKHITTYET